MSFEFHHLIPKQLFDDIPFLQALEGNGLLTRDGSANFIALPTDVGEAGETGQARHKGSHSSAVVGALENHSVFCTIADTDVGEFL